MIFHARLQVRLEAEKRILPQKENKIIRFLKPAFGLAASFALNFYFGLLAIKNFISHESKLLKSFNLEICTIAIDDNQYHTIVESIDENSFYALLDEPDNCG